MQKKEKSKKNSNDKLRNILDNLSIKDLSSEEKKYLKSLWRRIKGQSVKDAAHYKKILGVENEKEIDPLKPRVTIHRRKERGSLEIPEAKKFIPEMPKPEEKKEIPGVLDKKEELYEAEKLEIREPEFIEVKPKETLKVEKEKTVKETTGVEEEKVTDEIKDFEDVEEKELAEWEPIDVKEEKIDNNVSEPVAERMMDDASERNFCTQCGTKIEEGAFNFCPACGSKLILGEEEQELHDEKKEIEEEVESVPSFIPVKKIEEEDEPAEWKPIETDIAKDEGEISVKEEKIEKKTEKEIEAEIEEEITERKQKTGAFKDIECIDEKTAVLLYDNGFTSFDDLVIVSLKDLKKIDGVNNKLAKKIKKEIEEILKELSKEKNGFSEYLIDEDFEKDNDKIVNEKILEETEMYFDSDVKEEKIEEIEVFKGLSSIGQKTAKLLYDNGITSIDILRETPIEELVKIRGIRKKLAKNIKKELETLPKKKEDEEIEKEDVTYEGDDLGEWECFDEEQNSELKPKKIKGHQHKDYTLYEKKITMKDNKKRTVRFFSKAEPDEGKAIDLPEGYEAKENKKTGVPYLKKKKK